MNHFQCKRAKVSFEIGRELKSIGFDWKCDYLDGDRCESQYSGDAYLGLETYTPMPTQSMVVDWFRIKHNIHIDVGWGMINFEDVPLENHKWWKLVTFVGIICEIFLDDSIVWFNSFEEAQLAGISEAIEMIKQKAK